MSDAKKHVERSREIAEKKRLMDVRFEIRKTTIDGEEFGFKYDVFVRKSKLPVLPRKKS